MKHRGDAEFRAGDKGDQRNPDEASDARPAGPLGDLTTHQDMSQPDARARLVRTCIRRRRRREQLFRADVFADPVWDMMLDLYAAHYERRKVSVSSLCIAASVPSTTALRWIATMTDFGWLVRTGDAADGRRFYLELSDDARGRLDSYFDDLDT